MKKWIALFIILIFPVQAEAISITGCSCAGGSCVSGVTVTCTGSGFASDGFTVSTARMWSLKDNLNSGVDTDEMFSGAHALTGWTTSTYSETVSRVPVYDAANRRSASGTTVAKTYWVPEMTANGSCLFRFDTGATYSTIKSKYWSKFSPNQTGASCSLQWKKMCFKNQENSCGDTEDEVMYINDPYFYYSYDNLLLSLLNRKGDNWPTVDNGCTDLYVSYPEASVRNVWLVGSDYFKVSSVAGTPGDGSFRFTEVRPGTGVILDRTKTTCSTHSEGMSMPRYAIYGSYYGDLSNCDDRNGAAYWDKVWISTDNGQAEITLIDGASLGVYANRLQDITQYPTGSWTDSQVQFVLDKDQLSDGSVYVSIMNPAGEVATKEITLGGEIVQYTLSVTNGGNALVTSSPSGISCPSTCEYDFDEDTEIVLTADPDSGYTGSWSGDCTPTVGHSASVSMSAAKACTWTPAILTAGKPSFTAGGKPSFLSGGKPSIQ